MPIRGSVDVVTTSGAMGWAYSRSSKSKLTVQAMLNQEVIGEAIADGNRPDLVAAGFGDGACGFRITFYHEVDPLYFPFITVKLGDSDVDLPRSATSGYCEFFEAFYCKYPMTGRSRSVFGGLWTDRIDASALLRDRVEIGMVAPEVSTSLLDFLTMGFLILADIVPEGAASTPRFGAKRGKLPATLHVVGTVLKLKPVLDILHPILEGYPLALGMDVVEETNDKFRQFSAFGQLPSPAECLGLIVPLYDSPVELHVVRDSHLFPEFTADGRSRWSSRSGTAAIEVALGQHSMVDRYKVQPGSVVIVGPGLIHCLRMEPEAAALRVQCTPSRHAPLDRMLDGSCKEVVFETGGRVWI